MKVMHTIDSPILLKLIPESFAEAYENGKRAHSLEGMKIPHRVEDNGALILNIDPACKDFADDREPKNWR